jgi:methenyltetrahydrofolate cyclohydrolase
MSEVYNWSVRELMEKSASNSPTPGGGSVSALVGSLGCCMVNMVGNLTSGEKFAEVEVEAKTLTSKGYEILANLEALVAADIKEFSNFMDVLKMPRNTDEEKAVRTELMQKVLKSATDTPLEIARTCLEALKLADKLSAIGNKTAISDVGVGAYVAEAALNGALLSVDINVPMIKDPEYVKKANDEKEALKAEAKVLREKAVAVVQERMK